MSPRVEPRQPTLFELPTAALEAAPVSDAQRTVATCFPPSVRFGAMSWSFPGWRGLVYGQDVEVKRIVGEGLTPYSKQPLFDAVEIDRSYYEPLPAETFQRYARQVPEHFRFVVKAHEDCTVRRFPSHARYGRKRGTLNPRAFDPSYATNAVIGPTVEGLGEKLGAILFQYSPQEVDAPSAFADQLRAFLKALPKGVTYAVELRNRELVTQAYSAALEETGAVHCHNAWSQMPSVLEQARQLSPATRRPLLVRWLLRNGQEYAATRARFAPFDHIVEEDATGCASIVALTSKAIRHDVPALILVSNKAEGCAPQSILRLAQELSLRIPHPPQD